jgi:opacity protein-like surface antigen
MKARLLLLTCVALLLALTRPACGQVVLPDASDRFAWKPPARATANVLSNVTLGGQVVWATVDSLRGAHKKRDLERQACSFGLAQGAALGFKAAFSRLRPDQSNDHSFISGHTATTFSQGWELGAGTAYFRMGAAKHDIFDVLAGAGVGVAARSLCSALIR